MLKFSRHECTANESKDKSAGRLKKRKTQGRQKTTKKNATQNANLLMLQKKAAECTA